MIKQVGAFYFTTTKSILSVKYLKKYYFLIFFLSFLIKPKCCFSNIEIGKLQEQDNVSYSFILVDYTQKPFTMRQFNENYLSLLRLTNNSLYKSVPQKYKFLIPLSEYVAVTFYLIPLTHEEGHRSVLTALNIGSISSPVFKKGVAIVNGVTNATLKNLRDTDLPNFIRLHTAGIESDYTLAQLEENLIMFNYEKPRNLVMDYFIRKLGVTLYISGSSFFPSNHGISESSNELENDIVGDDVLGAVRHLHRPQMNYFRYTGSKDLTDEELNYLKKTGWLALINLFSPIYLNKKMFPLGNSNIKIGIIPGYILAPFGDMIEENFYLNKKTKNKNINLRLFVRQFGNKERYFWGSGLELNNYGLSKNFRMNTTLQYWNQPKDLDFNATSGQLGFGIETKLGYLITFQNKNSFLESMSIDYIFRYKTVGFIPNEPYLQRCFNTALGISFTPKF